MNNAYSERFKIEINPYNNFNLPDNIFYFPNTNVSNINLDGDIVYSRFVLEHVPPEEILRMHLNFKEQLKPGAKIFHFISPSDHRAYGDSELSLQDFLKYSEEEWNQKMTSFDYHNRLRLPQYKAIFEKVGLKILYLNYSVPDKSHSSYSKFKNLKIHPDFHHFSENELLAGAINIVLEV